MRVDAHHHLWRYQAQEFDWIDDSMAVLKRDFLVAAFERVAASAGIEASVAVQARQTIEETRWLLALAAQSPVVRGVVGWLPIAAPGFRGDTGGVCRRSAAERIAACYPG